MIIGLQTTNLCQLKCKNCANSIIKAPKIENKLKNMDTFKEVIKRMINFSLTRFNFTPTLGDPFTDSTMIEKLEWMDEQPEVEIVEFFTNFLGLTDIDIERLIKLKKIRMCISVYGCTPESYNDFTGTNGVFFIWEKNLSILQQYWRNDFPIFYFCIRNKDFYNKQSKIQTIIDSMRNNYDNIKIDDISKNSNWAGLFKKSNTKEIFTACQQLYIGTQILENGNITLCGCWDAKQEMIIGNIFEQSFKEIYGESSLYQQYLTNQEKGIFEGICLQCDDRESWKPKQELKY